MKKFVTTALASLNKTEKEQQQERMQQLNVSNKLLH